MMLLLTEEWMPEVIQDAPTHVIRRVTADRLRVRNAHSLQSCAVSHFMKKKAGRVADKGGRIVHELNVLSPFWCLWRSLPNVAIGMRSENSSSLQPASGHSCALIEDPEGKIAGKRRTTPLNRKCFRCKLR